MNSKDFKVISKTYVLLLLTEIPFVLFSTSSVLKFAVITSQCKISVLLEKFKNSFIPFLVDIYPGIKSNIKLTQRVIIHHRNLDCWAMYKNTSVIPDGA